MASPANAGLNLWVGHGAICVKGGDGPEEDAARHRHGGHDQRGEDVRRDVGPRRAVVAEVQAQRFEVLCPPARTVCKECDFRSYCVSQKTIDAKAVL